ncbi:hypothetical protein ACLOJK_018866 [Asimina triloba]
MLPISDPEGDVVRSTDAAMINDDGCLGLSKTRRKKETPDLPDGLQISLALGKNTFAIATIAPMD